MSMLIQSKAGVEIIVQPEDCKDAVTVQVCGGEEAISLVLNGVTAGIYCLGTI